ncbi:MAG TPA: FAD-dependent oxidoreductase [Acidimicrobiia bacterium]|nr:FAD-dependent oxidoreductase [Acidimicrobiia bacterium]
MTASTWREPARDLPVLARPDVLVVGAGSAGISAAIAAARRGADVLLAERYGFIGGLATFGLINLLLTMDDGRGSQVVGGLCQEFVDRLDQRGDARYPPQHAWGSTDPTEVERWREWGLIWGAPPDVVRYSVAFDPEAYCDVAFDLLAASGARLRLHSWCAHAYRDDAGRIETVVLESKRGREVVQPKVVIDASGDGDVMVAAGAAHESVTIPPWLWFRMGGLDDDAEVGFRTTGTGRRLVPWGPLPRRVDATDPDDLTAAELECRAEVRAEVAKIRAQHPSAWLDDIAKMIGITESRRLVGDYVLEKSDADRRFPDAIARTGHWTKREVVYDVPYRCLTSPSASNLLVAGRCISASRYVHQATKEIPPAMATGEAAGAAATHALSNDGDVRSLDVDRLRTDLRDAGAMV